MAQTQPVTSNANHTSVERLVGFNFVETAGAAASLELREGTVTGTVVKYLNLAAGEVIDSMLLKPTYWEFPGGCYVKVVSGVVSGNLYYP